MSSAEVLVLTGAAGAGKSTAFLAVAGTVPGTCFIDGDTLASARRPWDYDEYWEFTMRVCGDVLRNGLVPVICGIGLPSQVLPAAESAGFRVNMLALVCPPEFVRRRVVERGYGEAWRHPERHVAVNRDLQTVMVAPPHEFATYDTARHDARETARAVAAWSRSAVEQSDTDRWA
ncbi:hypothetical protein [Curtobacterium sp. Leaf261]|uniref:hypothetical protein n=1 Tax=Curtobacterium sp. Leaf261 TaxID=1736311 RepID=UPI0006FDA5F2|nr:hypothetical protein [Curtobacterium sp. Leaf261]KQO64138.1 hypothetical protein ASF23_17625 [Curtobacterium sp. Leaf261]